MPQIWHNPGPRTQIFFERESERPLLVFVLQKRTRKQLRWDEPASTKRVSMFGDSGTIAFVRAGSPPIKALQRELWALEGHGLASVEMFNGIVESRGKASTGRRHRFGTADLSRRLQAPISLRLCSDSILHEAVRHTQLVGLQRAVWYSRPVGRSQGACDCRE